MWLELSKSLVSLMSHDDEEKHKKHCACDILLKKLVAQSRTNLEAIDKQLHQSPPLHEVYENFRKYLKVLQGVADKYVPNTTLGYITVPGLRYYLEMERERKNPCWKNRRHRFCDRIDINKIEELNDYLELATIVYADTAEEIEAGLKELVEEFETYYINVESNPGEPAHFLIALKECNGRDLHVLMGVRGTKSMSDAFTDLLCDHCEYRGGKGHTYIVQSGTYLFEKHWDGLEELCRKARKSPMNLKLVSHSLGAGAASITGMEFNDQGKFKVKVVGFGCPPVVSLKEAEKLIFITTMLS